MVGALTFMIITSMTFDVMAFMTLVGLTMTIEEIWDRNELNKLANEL